MQLGADECILTCTPTSDRDNTLSAGAAESPASLDFASNFFSNVRYITPVAAMRNPPDKLFFFYVSEIYSAAESSPT